MPLPIGADVALTVTQHAKNFKLVLCALLAIAKQRHRQRHTAQCGAERGGGRATYHHQARLLLRGWCCSEGWRHSRPPEFANGQAPPCEQFSSRHQGCSALPHAQCSLECPTHSHSSGYPSSPVSFGHAARSHERSGDAPASSASESDRGAVVATERQTSSSRSPLAVLAKLAPSPSQVLSQSARSPLARSKDLA